VTTPVLSPTEAEVHFAFHLRADIAGAELRGRLAGPRCPYSSTIEIAYPIRPPVRSGPMSRQIITGRVVIPEPSLWDPIAPFLYQGIIELVVGGEALMRVQVSHGLRSLHWGPQGLRWNGQPLALRTQRIDRATAQQALDWHAAGVNTWLIDYHAGAGYLCALADRFGFLVLMALEGAPDPALLSALSEHACCAGWIVRDESARDRLRGMASAHRQLVAVRPDGLASLEADNGLLINGIGG
jgi:hypothetical protein